MDTLSSYLRAPPVSLSDATVTRLDTVGEMIERLRRLACQKLSHNGTNPSVSARYGFYGWEIKIFAPLGPDKEFPGDTLSAAYTAAMAWATRDEVAEGYATLGCDEHSRVIEPGWAL